MRITHVIPLLSLLALAGCSKASAATVDPNNDFDCATTFGFFREVAKLQGNAPDKARQGLFIMNQWYLAKWTHEHPGEKAKQRDHEVAMVTAMGKDHQAYLDALSALRTCTDRVSADPKFDRFARLMQERAPDAR
jgi:hypothetical protein